MVAPPLILSGTLDDAARLLALSAEQQASRMGVSLPAAAHDALRESLDALQRILALALYLCADADITRRGRPTEPRNPAPTRSGGGRWAVHSASGPTEWDVGTRIGAALRAAYAAEAAGETGETGRQVRPHIRLAHWHTFVSGRRLDDQGQSIPTDQRRRELRWLPPIPINVDDVDALPAVVRPVK